MEIGYGALCAVGVVVAIAFLAVGDVFVPSHGTFTGAGVTKHWSTQ